ncbi:MAG TPA: polyphosphate kinase 2 family protein [Thermoanaerobaculia bacterium]|nr:polyphosphate kinase 2 family protein [Thermoanaerobaculia bacterium]HXT49797.1 polyphosphate kinase 2 family protein [Thermoanaerobaculia bacterium]
MPDSPSELAERLRLKPGKRVRLDEVDPDDTLDLPRKEQALRALEKNVQHIAALQERLFAEHRRALLVVFQALDAGGKDGTTRAVFSGVNPQGCRVTSFKAPTAEELAHDFLWRIHRAVPGRGEIGIFNRSHYEDVLVVRVDGLVPKKVWSRRYEQINRFERQLVDTGTEIVKIFLHISRDEQAERLRDRIATPEKRWKFSPDDLRKRAQWGDYMKAYEDALRRCGTEQAPWYLVPANRNWVRNLAVSAIVRSKLEEMDPQVPEPKWDPSVIVIE